MILLDCRGASEGHFTLVAYGFDEWATPLPMLRNAQTAQPNQASSDLTNLRATYHRSEH